MLYYHYFFNCCLSLVTLLAMLHTEDTNHRKKKTKSYCELVGKGRLPIISALGKQHHPVL